MLVSLQLAWLTIILGIVEEDMRITKTKVMVTLSGPLLPGQQEITHWIFASLTAVLVTGPWH